MTTVGDEELYVYAERVRGKVVLITGAASGIGKETALQYANYGAKVVLGDVSEEGVGQVLCEIRKHGGEGVCQKCDVVNWEEQVALFDLAIASYGSVDFVIANAGVNEIGEFYQLKMDDRGRPVRPEMKTLDIDLIGTVYSAHLAIHYFEINRASPDSLKALVVVGSMASWQAGPYAALYSASKHGVLGLARALYFPLAKMNIRTSVIHPFFVDTALLTKRDKVLSAGVPLLPVGRVAGAILLSATDPSPASNGSVWILPDGGPTLKLEKEFLTEGVYKILNERTRIYGGRVSDLQVAATLWKVIWKKMALAVLVPAIAGSIIVAKL